MRALGLHHVSINVERRRARRVASTSTSSARVERSDRPDFGFGGAWLDVGDQQIHLIEAPVPDDQGQHLALLVDDLDDTIAELRSDGIEVSDPSPVGTGRQAFTHDPSGNLVELHQTGVGLSRQRSAVAAVAVAEEAARGAGVGVVVVGDVAHVVVDVVAVEHRGGDAGELAVHVGEVVRRRVDAVPAPHDHRRVADLALGDPAHVVLVEPVGDLGGLAQVAAVGLLAPGHPRIIAPLRSEPMDSQYAGTGYLALPEGGAGPGILVLHAWWGLTDHVRHVCDQLASEGYVALAPDLFDGQRRHRDRRRPRRGSRTPTPTSWPTSPGRASPPCASMAHTPDGPVGLLGWSMGASMALWLAARVPDDVAATAVYYGGQDIDMEDARCAFLGHYAETDPYVDEDGLVLLESELHLDGLEVEFHRYPGTSHWFAEPDRPEHDHDAAALAWDRTLDFFESYLPPGGA